MKNRNGVSLMEVLISIFVLSIGLMGVAALLPAGGFNIAKTNEADRSASCGRAALRDIKIRNLLDQTKWTAPGSSGKPTLIDPLGPNTNFPYCSYATFPSGSPVISISRVGLTSTPNRIFIAEDDLVFVKPENDDERPVLLNDGTGTQPTKGDYSWMFMVSPDNRVSVVVFHRRNFSPPLNLSDVGPNNPKPSERVVVAEFGGQQPIDVELSMPQNPSITQLGIGLDEYLDVRKNSWVLLTNGIQFVWYRVVAVANELENGKRLVSFAGADWAGTKLDLDGDGIANELQAVVCDGVVGVYSQPLYCEK